MKDNGAPEYSEELADLISQQAEDVYKTGHFSRVNIVAHGQDGYTYQAVHEDELERGSER